MQYDLIAYIGRFQPYHVGHKVLVDNALKIAAKVAIVLGSAETARSEKNPFTAAERIEMIKASHPDALDRLVFIPQVDYPYNYDRWLSEVTGAITAAAVASKPLYSQPAAWQDGKVVIGLTGFDKDASSFYLRGFPQWDFVPPPNDLLPHNATSIREDLFLGEGFADGVCLLTDGTMEWLRNFRVEKNASFLLVANEMRAMKLYHKQWESVPYPPTFVTTDAVVTQDAHVLLVTRGAYPGYGLFALPGGFIGPSETLEDSMLRELAEETAIKVPKAVLRGSIVSRRVFDAPFRSARGRTITHAFHVRLNEAKLPKVKGSDDAAHAMWVPLSKLKRDALFEDHYDIIQTMVGL